MECTHPVLYMNTRDGSMRCHICGKVFPQPSKEEIFKGGKEVTLPPLRAAKPPDAESEKPKPAPKRGKKPNAD